MSESRDNTRISDLRCRLATVVHLALWCCHPAVALFEIPFRLWSGNARLAIAFWIRDPVRVRGRCIALFHAAQTFVLAFCTAGAMMSVFFILYIIGVDIRRIPDWIAWALIVGSGTAAAVAIVCASLFSLVAIAHALWHRQKIWMDVAATPETALGGHWPPISDLKQNGVGFVAIFPVVLICFAVAFAAEPFGLPVGIGAALAAGIPIFLVIRPVIADAPAECYPESTSPFDQCSAALESVVD
jgi:hypothetical protein